VKHHVKYLMMKIQSKKKKVHSYLIVNPQKMFCPTFGTDLLLMKELLSKAEKMNYRGSTVCNVFIKLIH